MTSRALLTRDVTALFFAWFGWCDVNARYLSLCVFFRCTLVSKVPSSCLVTNTSRKGSFFSCSFSTVKLMEGDTLFRWLKTFSTADFCRKQKVSSTYLLQNLTTCGDVRMASFFFHMLHENVGDYRGYRGSHGCSICLLKALTLVDEVGGSKTDLQE